MAYEHASVLKLPINIPDNIVISVPTHFLERKLHRENQWSREPMKTRLIFSQMDQNLCRVWVLSI